MVYSTRSRRPQNEWLGKDCIRREVEEETGLHGGTLRLRGLLTFVIDDTDELSFLYTGTGFSGELKECDEGELVWVEKTDVYSLPLWEGDKLFFRLLEEDRPFFSLKLIYVHDRLVSAALNGETFSLS